MKVIQRVICMPEDVVLPKIVCLCGSTRFVKEFIEAQFRETFAGNIVLTVSGFPRKPDGTRAVVSDEQKVALDILHFQKIELADEIFVINVGGYIGPSTRKEVSHALELDKVVRFLEEV